MKRKRQQNYLWIGRKSSIGNEQTTRMMTLTSLFAKSWTTSSDQPHSWLFLALTNIEITSTVIFNIVATGNPTMAVS
jgi:hypothetical protein